LTTAVFNFRRMACGCGDGATRSLLLKFQVGGFYDVAEHLDVALDLLAKLFAGTAAGVDRHGLELLAHSRVGQRATRFHVELVGNGGRRPGCNERGRPETEIPPGGARVRPAPHVL